MLFRLRSVLARRKWILWVLLACLVLVAYWIGVLLLPHHVLNTLRQYEEKSDGRTPPVGNAPAVISFGVGWLR